MDLIGQPSGRGGEGCKGRGQRRKGCGGEWFYFNNNNKQAQTANCFSTNGLVRHLVTIVSKTKTQIAA